MLQTGSIVLSLWCLLNGIPAFYIVVTTFTGSNHPLLKIKMNEEEVSTLSPETLSLINSMGLFANGAVMALCFLSLIAIWISLNRRVKWTFWALFFSIGFYVLAGFAADLISQSNYYTASIISALIIVSGFSFAAIGLFQNKRDI